MPKRLYRPRNITFRVITELTIYDKSSLKYSDRLKGYIPRNTKTTENKIKLPL